MPGPNDTYMQPGIELLGDSEGSGHLNVGEDGRAFRQLGDAGDAQRPSLASSGSPQGKARGIGGTLVSAQSRVEQPNGGPAGHMDTGQSRAKGVAAERSMTPQEMMAMADNMEQDFLEKSVMSKAEQQMGQSSVSGSMEHGDSHQGVPDWLHQYMSQQPPTDPYHQVPMSGLDMVKQNKYLSEQERLRYLKSLRKN